MNSFAISATLALVVLAGALFAEAAYDAYGNHIPDHHHHGGAGSAAASASAGGGAASASAAAAGGANHHSGPHHVEHYPSSHHHYPSSHHYPSPYGHGAGHGHGVGHGYGPSHNVGHGSQCLAPPCHGGLLQNILVQPKQRKYSLFGRRRNQNPAFVPVGVAHQPLNYHY